MSNKRAALLSILLVISILFFFLQGFVFHSKDIVYVDSQKLMNGYKGMVEARKDFEKKRSAWQANIDTLTRDVQNAIKKYSKDQALGSPKEKELSKALIQSKQKELYDYQNAIKQNASQEEERVNQEIFTTINTYLSRYGKKNGYKMILIAANGNIAYADPSMEITDKIVEDLNREYSVPAK
jgi:outer membrane protein